MDKKRIEQLIKLIDEANYNYYVLDKPTISDQEYDRYMQELIALEKNNPGLIAPNSPTKKVGGVVIEQFNKIEHSQPMLSLDNLFTELDVVSFDHSIKKDVKEPVYSCELKIDGLAIALIYENGKLVRGVTRGDGYVGEDVTHNIVTIKDIPLKLKQQVDIEIRGEVYMDKETFTKLNNIRETENKSLFANPRNAAAGSIRQLDSTIAAKRNLKFIPYYVLNSLDHNITSHYDSIKYIEELGFAKNKHIKQTKDINKIIQYISFYEQNRNTLPYEIDGIVIKIDNIVDQNKLGITSRHPKWSAAYKFKAQEVTTRIKDITFTVGRTGQITPNAVLEPVRVAGSVVSRATLHNEDYIKDRDIKINDIVVIRKAGDIIPEVIKPDVNRRTGSEVNFKMISKCPICKSNLVREKAKAAYYCLNENCDAKKQESLLHFVSRNAMNIEGFGERVIEEFYNLGYLKSIKDFYKLYNYKEELMKLEGFGEKSINKLISNIEKSKNNSLDKLIFSLGIRYVGSKTSNILAKEFKNIDSIMNATFDELLEIKEIGESIANSVTTYFLKEENIKLIEELVSMGVNTNYIETEMIYNEIFNNKQFVLTGTLESMTRSDAKERIKKLGGKIINNVSKNTDIVIVGKNPGRKYENAKNLNIKIWNELEFIKILKNVSD